MTGRGSRAAWVLIFRAAPICVKGMVWSITNILRHWWLQGLFRWANLSNDMSDREFVTALSNSVVNNVATKFSSQPPVS